MARFVREKQIYTSTRKGDERKEIEIYTQSTGRQKFYSSGERRKRTAITAPKQQKLNDERARKYFRRLVETNFSKNDYHLTATYSDDHLPKSIEEGESNVSAFVRRLKRLYARNKKVLKYIIVTAYRTKDGDPVRMHHHILLSGGVSRDEIEKLWYPKGARTNAEKSTMLGACNCDRLQPSENGLDGLCNYLFRQPREGLSRRWKASTNLRKPTETKPHDYKYSVGDLQDIIKDYPSYPDIKYWERKYPGWTVEPNYDYSYKANVDVMGGMQLLVKLRKIQKNIE